ncbi:MAG: PhoH family protein [bacterium]
MDERIILASEEEVRNLFGRHDENLRLIREATPAKIVARGNEIIIKADSAGPEEIDLARRLFDQLLSILRSGHILSGAEVRYALRMIREDKNIDLARIFSEAITVSYRGRLIRPRTLGQKSYVEAIERDDITIGIGPAGTGKTYLAMAMAIQGLLKKEVDRIILTRPAVEAGEKLGFLPGDLMEKVNPYLRPLYDALYDMMSLERAQRLIETGVIEVAPLAFMRGRTLNDAFIILDEAQNTTPEQIKMFLTRLGFDSKAVITGDITQIDLPNGCTSGLVQIQYILKGIKGISFIYFTEADVVRHSLVQKIVKAYEAYQK